MKLSSSPVTSFALIAFLLSVAWLSPGSGLAQNHRSKNPEILLSADKISNGHIILVQIAAGNLIKPVGSILINFNQRSYRAYPHPVKGDGYYIALVGVPYRIKPGPQMLQVSYSDKNGKQTKEIPFLVMTGKYKTDILKVDSRRVNPNKKDRQRASREYQEIKQVYASATKEKLWQGTFQLPVKNKITSQFGNRRVFNGELKSYHNGLDFRSPQGTPAYAANSGIVRVAKNLFYSGNAVIIDHGTGIFTIYAHLSKIKTVAGRRIEKGGLIGLTGATGRVSGPHLHWGVKINGVAVSPLQFVKIMDGLHQRPSL